MKGSKGRPPAGVDVLVATLERIERAAAAREEEGEFPPWPDGPDLAVEDFFKWAGDQAFHALQLWRQQEDRRCQD